MPTLPTMDTRQKVPYVPRRLHIVPVGFEEERVVLPATALKAERVILLANPPKEDKAGKFREAVKRGLEKRNIEVEVLRAQIFDLGQTLDVMVRVLRENSRDHLAINISAGSKIQALAGCLSAMILRAEGIEVTVYYAEPRRYRENPPKTPLSFGLKQVIEVAPISLPTPPEEVKLAMQLLTQKNYHKLELALALATRGQLDPSRVGNDGAPVDDKARVSLQTSVDQKVVQPLVRAGYARAQRDGKKVTVSLTESGRMAASLLTAGMGAPR